MCYFKLSERMSAVAGLVPAGCKVCDVGCDHAFVSIYLIQHHISDKVYALDINEGPLERAREHIRKAGLEDYIETRLSDGLSALRPGEADCMIAAGIGGRLTVKILADSPDKVRNMKYLVLQPQSELAYVRRFLRENGFLIIKEDMVSEDGKYYPMMLVKTGEKACAADEVPETLQQEAEDAFGPCLIHDGNPVLKDYLSWREGCQNKILQEAAAHPERKRQVEEELARIQAARLLIEEAQHKKRVPEREDRYEMF